MNVTPPAVVRKSTGLTWAPEVPSDWDIKRGKFLFDLQKRAVLPDDDIVTAFRDGQVTLRKNRRTDGFTNALKEAGYQRVHKGDLIIHAMDAFAGAVGVSDSDGKCTPVYSCCTPREGVSAEFYARMIRTMALSGFIESLAKGIRERSTDFRWREFAEQPLPVPPLEQQLKINRFLDRETAWIDGLIEKKARFIALLKEKRIAVIAHAVTKGLNRNAPMTDSGQDWLGEMPAHWGLERMKYGLIEKTAKKSPDLPPGAISYGKVVAKDAEKITAETRATYQEVLAGEYLINPINLNYDLVSLRTALSEMDVCVSPAYIVLRAVTEKVHPVFGNYVLHVFDVCHMKTLGAGVRQTITFKDIGQCVWPLPPMDEQVTISQFLDRETDQIDTLISKTEQSIALLKEKRAALITAAVTGKIDVRTAA